MKLDMRIVFAVFVASFLSSISVNWFRSTVETETAVRIVAPLQDQNVNDNGDALFGATEIASSEWTHAAGTNSFVWSGDADVIEIHVTSYHSIVQNLSIQRPAPVLELYKGGALVAASATGYIRDNNDHEESSNHIYYVDANPGASETYTVETRQESGNGGDVTSVNGQFAAVALKPVIVKPSIQGFKTNKSGDH